MQHPQLHDQGAPRPVDHVEGGYFDGDSALLIDNVHICVPNEVDDDPLRLGVELETQLEIW